MGNFGKLTSKLICLSSILLISCTTADSPDSFYVPPSAFYNFEPVKKYRVGFNESLSVDLAELEEPKLWRASHPSSLFRLFVQPSGEAIASDYLFRFDYKDGKPILVFKVSNSQPVFEGMTGPGSDRSGIKTELTQELTEDTAKHILAAYQSLDLCNLMRDWRKIQDGNTWVFEGFDELGRYCVRTYSHNPGQMALLEFQDFLFSFLPSEFSNLKW